MKRFNVTVEKEIIVEFDDNSEDFKQLFKNYKESFDPYASHSSLAEDIARHVSRYGVKELFEGIGYLKYNGENQYIYSTMENTKRRMVSLILKLKPISIIWLISVLDIFTMKMSQAIKEEKMKEVKKFLRNMMLAYEAAQRMKEYMAKNNLTADDEFSADGLDFFIQNFTVIVNCNKENRTPALAAEECLTDLLNQKSTRTAQTNY